MLWNLPLVKFMVLTKIVLNEGLVQACSGLWPFRLVAFSVCGHFGLWLFWYFAVSICGHFNLWPFRFVAVQVCDCFGLWPFWLWPFRLWPLWPVTMPAGIALIWLFEILFWRSSSHTTDVECTFLWRDHIIWNVVHTWQLLAYFTISVFSIMF